MRVTMAAVIVSVVVSLGAPALADVLELKDGRRIEGKLKGASPAIVAIDVGGRTMVFESGDVRALYLGDAPPVPAPPAAAAPVAMPAPEEKIAPPQPIVGREATAALEALRGLQDVVARLSRDKGTMGQGDYTSRVIKARATVQTYLQNPAAPESDVKALMNAAMSLYTLAGHAWGVRLRKAGYESLAANPAADLCPDLMEKMETAREQGLLKPNPLGQGIGVAAGLPQIWACAGEKVDEVARLMAPVSK
jgi:hypothetical protein